MSRASIAPLLGRKIGFLASVIASTDIRPTGDPMSGGEEECSHSPGPFAERGCY